jgi:hypothetical protein
MTFHGFASQGFLASTGYNYLRGNTKEGSFEYSELGLNTSMSPFNSTRIALQGFAFDVGDVGGYQPFLDYASLEYSFSDHIGLRGGRIRRPGGIYNHIQDVDLARTSILLPQGMYDARWRDFSTSIDGGELFGSASLGKAGSLSYEAFAGMMNLTQDGGVAHWILNGQPTATLDSFEQPLAVGAQLWWNTPVNGLRAGAMMMEGFDLGFNVSSPVSPNGPAGPIVAHVNNMGSVFMQQYSLEYQYKSWTFQAEYYTFNYRYTQTQNVFSGPVLVQSETSSQYEHPDAWYVGASYRANKWLEVGTYYTEFYADVNNRNGIGRGSPSDAAQKDLALSFRFDPTDWWILKLEGHYIRGTGLLQDNERNPVRDDKDWFLLAMKTTFSF